MEGIRITLLKNKEFWQLHRTYIVTQIRGGLVLIAMIIMSVNLIVDLLYGMINPRILHTGS